MTHTPTPSHEELLEAADEAALVLYTIEAHAQRMANSEIKTLAKKHGEALKAAVGQAKAEGREA